MAVSLWDEFDVLVSPSSISRALRSINWSKKTARRVAQERNPDLRDFYLHNLSAFRSYHLVFVDESGCDKLIGFRKRLAGLHLVLRPFRLLSCTGADGIKSCQRTRKTESSYLVCFRVQQRAESSKISSSSSSLIVASGRSRSP